MGGYSRVPRHKTIRIAEIEGKAARKEKAALITSVLPIHLRLAKGHLNIEIFQPNKERHSTYTIVVVNFSIDHISPQIVGYFEMLCYRGSKTWLCTRHEYDFVWNIVPREGIA